MSRTRAMLIVVLSAVVLIAVFLNRVIFDSPVNGGMNYSEIVRINNDRQETPATEEIKEGIKSNNSNWSSPYKPNSLSLTNRLDIIKSRRPEKEYNPLEIAEVVSRDTAWEVDSGLANYIDLSESEIYDGREFIQFDHLKVESLVSGDKLNLYIPHENEEYVAEITEVTLHGAGVISWQGTLEELPGGGKISITQGNEYAYISIFTPHAHYTVESKNGIGWIANTGALFKDEVPFIPIIDAPPGELVYPSRDDDPEVP